MRRMSYALLLVCAGLCLTGCKKSAKTYNKEGLAAIEEKDLKAAVEAFSHAADIDGENAAYGYNYAKSLYEAGDYAGCKKAMREVVKYEKNADKLASDYYILADACFKTGDKDNGVNALETYVNISYKNLSVYFKAYDLLMANDMKKTAISLLEQYNPAKGDDESLLGLRDYYLGNYDSALEHYKKSVKDKKVSDYLNIGIIYNTKGDYDKALSYITKYEETNTADSYVNYQKATCFQGLGRYEEAIEAYKKCMSMSNTYDRNCLYSLVLCSERIGDYAGAYDYADKFLQKYEDETIKSEKVFLESRK